MDLQCAADCPRLLETTNTEVQDESNLSRSPVPDGGPASQGSHSHLHEEAGGGTPLLPVALFDGVPRSVLDQPEEVDRQGTMQVNIESPSVWLCCIITRTEIAATIPSRTGYPMLRILPSAKLRLKGRRVLSREQ